MTINQDFQKYKLKKPTQTVKELCTRKKFKHQPQQLFLKDYFHSKYIKNGLLVFHKIGAGKTCTAINVAESYKTRKNIIVLLPASLIGNFKDELRSECAHNEYITELEREELKELSPRNKRYKEIIKMSDKRINKYYKIYSYHKYVELVDQNKIKLRNTLLIVDEVQNMVSNNGIFYRYLKKTIDKSDNKTKILLLSATPMFDKPEEIALTLNLLKLNIPIGNEFNNLFLKRTNESITMKNKELFKKYIKNTTSYYRGASPKTFPKEKFKLVKCNMEDFQYKSYLASLSEDGDYVKGGFRQQDILELPTNFMIGPRFLSNIAFPNKSVGINGYNSLKGRKLHYTNIKDYSKKFYKIFNNIKKSTGPCFVYSNFKEEGGIKSFQKFLEYNGFKNYKVHGPGKNRFAVWSGDERNSIREEIKCMFNQPKNHDGSQIKIILGTPSIKEGVSLLRVEQVHVMEPYWNMARLKQIFGRAIRFCSHKDLKASRRYVNVYLYMATRRGEFTTDEYIWEMAKQKQKLIDDFEHLLKEKAIDCKLFYNQNVYKGDKPLKCTI